jgi:hypothetical protein
MGPDKLIFGGTAFIKPLEQVSASWRMLEEVWMVEIELFHNFKADATMVYCKQVG